MKAGTTLIIHVNYVGVPRPSIEWQHNGKVIVPDNGTSIETTEAFTSLTIKGAGAENAGDYKVSASNVVDTVSADFTVVIKGEKEKMFVITNLSVIIG